MINAIELNNVRIFEGAGWMFQLHPLTVLCGVNSAGKSTLLKSLLLLRQSQGAGGLHISGPQVDFGDYRSFVSGGEIKRDASIGLTNDFPMAAVSVDALRAIGQRRSKRTKVGLKESVVSRVVRLRSNFVFTATRTKRQMMRPDGPNPDSLSVAAELKSATFELVVGNETLLSWKLELNQNPKYEEARYTILMPETYFKHVGGYRLMELDVIDGWVSAPVILDGLVPQMLVATPKQRTVRQGRGSPQAEVEKWQNFPLPPTIMQALWSFTETLENIAYLGPLRSPAKRYYIADLQSKDSTDATGEFLPYILRDQADAKVINIPPGRGIESQTQKLADALNGWMYYLRTGHAPEKQNVLTEVSLDTTKQVLVQINIKGLMGGGAYAISDSGFGYSQVLPILVKGLLTPVNSTFIVEQPELHLNPSLQVRLAEFFVAMVRAGKQVILETHSEHLVNSIRVLSAEDVSGLHKKCQIYFLDTGPDRPVQHELSIRPDGTVPDWPKQFFGEAVSLTGRLLRAQKEFRQQENRQ